jgi:hypothetical protein
MDPLPCDTVVYRAMARKKWVDLESKRILPAAFMRRPPPIDDDGLSVDTHSPESCVSSLNASFGVGSLYVGLIRTLELDVVMESEHHALITGVPLVAEDRDKAEWIASQLARQARFIAPQSP